MKFNIKLLSSFLVFINLLLVHSELPSVSMYLGYFILALSFFVHNPKLKLILKFCFLLISAILIKILFKPLVATESAICFIMLLSTIKTWELKNDTDYFNMFLILALFEASIFLINPGFLTFTFGLIKIIVYFYFILKIRNYDLSLLSGGRLLLLVVPSLTFAILLFYTFPRFTQSFIGLNNNQLYFSGNDSQFNMKNLGPLNLSSKVVFKISGLDEAHFPLPILYWRESVLWDYVKGDWKTGYFNMKDKPNNLLSPNSSYHIKLFKNYNEFLPILDGYSQVTKSNFPFNFYNEGTFRLRNITHSEVEYDVLTSTIQKKTTFSPLMMLKSTRLQSRLQAQIRADILNHSNKANLTDQEKFNLVVSFFNSKHFEYSLSPKPYTSLEDFILNGKNGYCSHFAAAFTYLLRSVDLPARIISGYQGGEYNVFDHSLIIRELDAHAWVEVYFSNTGWIRFDPTALVAPERIKIGATHFNLNINPNIDLYFFKISKNFFLKKTFSHISQFIDSMDGKLNLHIFNFDKERQQQLLSYFSTKKISIEWIFVIFLAGGLSFFWIIYQVFYNSPFDQNQKRYLKFLAKMKRKGLIKVPSETASAFCHRCLVSFPELNDYIVNETQLYLLVFYQKSIASKSQKL